MIKRITANLKSATKKEYDLTFTRRELLIVVRSIKLTEPKPVREFSHHGGFFYCPNCYSAIEIEYSNCCTVCGQHLSWKGYRKYAECISWDEAQRRMRLKQEEI